MRRGMVMGVALGAVLFGVGVVAYRTLRGTAPGPSSDPAAVEEPTAAAPEPPVESRAHRGQGVRNTRLPSLPPSDQDDGNDVSAEEGRRQEIQKLRGSGPDRRHLVDSARRVGTAWIEVAQQKKLDVTFGEWECFRGGCFVDARHGSMALVDQVTNQITHSTMFHQWNGEKMRTGPVETKGKAVVTWVLFPPPDGEVALQPAENFKGSWSDSEPSAPSAAGPGQPEQAN